MTPATTKTSGLVVACAVIGILLGVVGITISCFSFGTNFSTAVKCQTPAPRPSAESPGVSSHDLMTPLKKTMTLWFALGYLCSVLILAGGIGMLVRKKWGWWVSLGGYPVGGAALVAMMIMTRILPPVLVLDLIITIGMIAWLLAIRGRALGRR
ncbi:MAG: hypothetical protein KJ621_18755 [Proteobacteria bacterium]|nr:hypothetical protein [Pseudomonadota bacterium]MBU1740837.1 hypothetical protein [Pseudomonadota bacterium]